MGYARKGEKKMAADDKKSKPKWQGPKIKPMLQPLSINEKEAKIKITLLNTWQKRWVRLELEDTVPIDGVFEMEREKEYIVKIPKGVTSFNIKVIDVQTGVWDAIKVAPSLGQKKSQTEKPKDPIEIIGPCGTQKDFFVTVRTKEPHAPVSFSSNEELTVEIIDPRDGPNAGTHFEFETGDDADLIMRISFIEWEAILLFRVDGQNFKRMLIK